MEKLYVSGLDSAWGGRQKGALCHLLIDKEQDTISLIDTPVSVTWDDAIDDIEKQSTHLHHVIAIDQGLVVPNATKMRPVERMLASALGSMHCSAYPSNLSNESCYGPNAGIWRLLGSLNDRGYVHQPLEIPQA
jgi:predicted RNase H-like nuclease